MRIRVLKFLLIKKSIEFVNKSKTLTVNSREVRIKSSN